MCLIIKKPAGRTICTEFLKNAWQRNCHGWGGFFVQDGQVVRARGLHFEELLDYNRQLPANVEACIHLRKATYGEVNHEMAHPYLVRPGLMLMHNGSIHHLAPQDPSVSDTSELARLLGDLLAGLSDEQAAAMIAAH
jgi:predicted glutamine amidotransferase